MKLNLSDLNFKNNILDCTLRDGGYYNNWLFSNKLIREYIRFVEKNKINFVEIGFRFFDEIRTKGNTAYSDLSFIKSLNFRDQTSIGIMINGSDIVKFKNNKKIIDYFLDVLKSKRLGFVRIACHIKSLIKSHFHKKNQIKKKKDND